MVDFVSAFRNWCSSCCIFIADYTFHIKRFQIITRYSDFLKSILNHNIKMKFPIIVSSLRDIINITLGVTLAELLIEKIKKNV